MDAEQFGGLERMRKTRQQMKKIGIVCTVVSVLVLVGVFFLIKQVLVPMNYYNHAIDQVFAGDYSGAIVNFEKANGYKDSLDQIDLCLSLLGSTE